jgi:hypothetical protein
MHKRQSGFSQALYRQSAIFQQYHPPLPVPRLLLLMNMIGRSNAISFRFMLFNFSSYFSRPCADFFKRFIVVLVQRPHKSIPNDKMQTVVSLKIFMDSLQLSSIVVVTIIPLFIKPMNLKYSPILRIYSPLRYFLKVLYFSPSEISSSEISIRCLI